MRRRQLPVQLRQRVRQYERQKWAATRGVDEEATVRDLPDSLRRDIKRHLCLSLVRQVILHIIVPPLLTLFHVGGRPLTVMVVRLNLWEVLWCMSRQRKGCLNAAHSKQDCKHVLRFPPQELRGFASKDRVDYVQVPLFEQMDDLVLDNICERLKPLLLIQGETVCTLTLSSWRQFVPYYFQYADDVKFFHFPFFVPWCHCEL